MRGPAHDHPLTGIALKAFAESGQDARSLVPYLSGVSSSGAPAALVNAYMRVSKDLIENLEARGLIYHGDGTWYYLSTTRQKGARP